MLSKTEVPKHNAMEVIPAIDIKDGVCVRLYQGDFEQETVFSHDPVEVALNWSRAGAPRIHIVDLNATRGDNRSNNHIIRSIREHVPTPLQVGGGLRTPDAAHTLLDLGIDRIVIGTLAIDNPKIIESLCLEWGANRIVIALDARKGQIAIKGWTENTSIRTLDLANQMISIGVERFLYTDISRDGTMKAPNFDAIQDLVQGTSKSILASGGVSSIDDILHLGRIGAEGTIVGTALYTGTIDLQDAINKVSE